VHLEVGVPADADLSDVSRVVTSGAECEGCGSGEGFVDEKTP
jgi:hypothetical protein